MQVVRKAEIQDAFNLNGAIDLIRGIYRMTATDRAAVSSPSALSMRGKASTQTRFKVKGAVLDELDVAGFRLIGDADPQHGKGQAYCYLVDPRSAAPLAMVEEEWLHGVRTALTGLVTVETLAPPRATQLALIGTGRIARHFAAFIARTQPNIRVVIASRAAGRAAEAARAWSNEFDAAFHAADTVPQALREAQIVVTLSDAQKPLFTASDLSPGTLVCAMGGRHEFDRNVLDKADRFIVDEVDFVCTAGNVAAWITAGTTTRPEIEAKIDTTIGGVLKTTDRAPTGNDEICLAVIQGMAACDVGLAKWILDRTAKKADG